VFLFVINRRFHSSSLFLSFTAFLCKKGASCYTPIYYIKLVFIYSSRVCYPFFTLSPFSFVVWFVFAGMFILVVVISFLVSHIRSGNASLVVCVLTTVAILLEQSHNGLGIDGTAFKIVYITSLLMFLV